MIAFSLSVAPGDSPQATSALSAVRIHPNRKVCLVEIIVNLLTIGGNHSTADRGLV